MLDSRSEPMLLDLAMGPVLFVNRGFCPLHDVGSLGKIPDQDTQTVERGDETLGLRTAHGPGHFLQNIVLAANY